MPDTNASRQKMEKAFNRLTRWKSVFAGWQLGTRSDTDPECNAVRDHRELSLLLRAEVTALTALMIEKGIFTLEEFMEQCATEADFLHESYKKRFPGMEATETGVTYDARAIETMKDWKP